LVEIWLPYGPSEVPARVPEERLVQILKPLRASPQMDMTAEIKRLVESDSGLLRAAKNAHRICLAVGASSNHGLLSDATATLIRSLKEAGIQDQSVMILLTDDAPDIEQSLGSGIQVSRHDPVSSEAKPLDAFKGDFKPSISGSFLDADLKMIVGELRPHHFLELTGLCDIVFPGLASSASGRMQLMDRKNVDISDIHKERMSIASSMQNLLALGFTLDGDLAPAKLSFGELDGCVDSLEPTLKKHCYPTVDKPADIVVMSAGGRPVDETLLRAVETFPAGGTVAKRDGAIIVAAECSRGHGDGDFYEWTAERIEPRHLEARLRYTFNYDGLKATYLRRLVESHRVYLVSTVPDHYVQNTFGLRASRTVNSAIQTAQRALGSDSTISVIPDASAVIPQRVAK